MRTVIACIAGFALMQNAAAQTLTPMRGDIVTFGDSVAVKLHVSNPYNDARRFSIDVLSLDWEPVPGAMVSRSSLQIAPGGASPIFVRTPVGADDPPEFYVCAMTSATGGGGAGLRGRVCGKYRAIRRQL